MEQEQSKEGVCDWCGETTRVEEVGCFNCNCDSCLLELCESCTHEQRKNWASAACECCDTEK